LYDPSSGRFLTRDSWLGEFNKPLSLNRWNFVEGNPINKTDPSGNMSVEDCDKIPDPIPRAICKKLLVCNSDACQKSIIVTDLSGANGAYKALANTPCELKGDVLYPWWKTLEANQKDPAVMDPTMLIAVLVYTEASPIRSMGSSEKTYQIWVTTATNRYHQMCGEFGGCSISTAGLSTGLNYFLKWSHRFWYGGPYYNGQINDPYTKLYGEPSWAYDIAKNIVGNAGAYDPSLPWGLGNTQSIDEERYFLNKYIQYGEGSADMDGVYYMWGAGINSVRQGIPPERINAYKDYIALTFKQAQHHCRPSGPMLCGQTP
jgi:hypothetical protein